MISREWVWEGSGCGYKRAMWNNRIVLCLDYIYVIILVVRLHYSFSRCYHWGKLNREYYVILGFPSGSPVKNTPARQELQETQVNLWVGKTPWGRVWQPTPVFLPGEYWSGGRVWQPTPVFLPGESYGQEEPGRLQSKGLQKVRNDWSKSACMHGIFLYYFLQLQESTITSKWRLSGKESAWQCRRPGLDPWVQKIPWRRDWQPTPVFLPGKSQG